MFHVVNRLTCAVTLLGIAAISRADWLIDTPVARKIPFKGMRYEFRSMLKGGLQEHRFGFGISETIEVVARTERLGSMFPTKATADIAFIPNGPVPGVAPGLAFGILDAANRTAEGRRGYFGLTFREDFDGMDGTNYGDITVGIIGDHYVKGFFGASIPFSKTFRLLAEHNGNRLAIGVDLRPVKNLSLRMIWRDRQILLGASIGSRF